jgi:glutathione S-transferase
MELFYSSGSPYARVIRIVVRELGMTEGLIETACALRSADNPALARTPLGRVPALALDDGTVLTETRVICEGLDDMAGGHVLFGPPPEAAAARAQDGLITGLMECLVTLVREGRRPEGARSETAIENERARIARCLDALSTQGLPEVPAYRACMLACALGMVESRGLMPGWREGHAALGSWYDRQMQRPSLRETLPE